MTPATDSAAPTGSGATAAVPTTAVTQTLNNVVYSSNTYLGTCVIPAGVTVNASCAPGAAVTGIGYLRVVVAVTWTGARCPPTGCALRDLDAAQHRRRSAVQPRLSPHPLHPFWPIRARRSRPSATPSICRPTIKAVPSYRVADHRRHPARRPDPGYRHRSDLRHPLGGDGRARRSP